MEAIDAVLTADPPRFTGAEAMAIGRARFGVVADGAVSLGSERDQTFLLTSERRTVAILKVSNAAEKHRHPRHGSPRRARTSLGSTRRCRSRAR